MPCFKPLTAYRGRTLGKSGKRTIVFDRNNALLGGAPMQLPCGQCIGCKLQRSGQWAIRCVHEAQSTLEDGYPSTFVTLTYNDKNLPTDRSITVKHLQEFWKRLRYHIKPQSIRYYACAEYGAGTGRRPHYHACIFGYQFPDQKLWKLNAQGQPLYISQMLQDIWGKGYCIIGEVTFKSAAYVARYIMKKITGDTAWSYYISNLDLDTGEFTPLTPEFTTMSLKPAIGLKWLNKYGTDVYPDDFCLINGRKINPPKYYDQQLELTDPSLYLEIKGKRKLAAARQRGNSTPSRLAVREVVKIAQTKSLKRDQL